MKMNGNQLEKRMSHAFKKYHKLINVSLGLLIVLTMALTGTHAWSSLNQRAFNATYQEADLDFEIILQKFEIDLGGERTENPVAGAGFVLYQWDEDEGDWVQGLLNGNGLFFTNVNGQIVFNLLPGDYVLREHTLPNGFGPAFDDAENPITSWYFTIRENSDTGELELVVDGYVVDDHTIVVFNQRLDGDLEIEKTVVNADGSPLTQEQLAQPFEFIVTFSDDESRTYRIFAGDELYSPNLYTVPSGGSIFLRHGQRAVFTGIPLGVEYQVREVRPDGFVVSGTNAQGVISGDPSLVSFENEYTPDSGGNRSGNLIIGKEVRGEGADLDREFRFVVYLGDERHEFTLRHGETREFENIPVGTPYIVYEYDYSEDGYWVNIGVRRGYITGHRPIEIWFVNRFIDPGCPSCKEGEGDLEIGKTVVGDEIDENQLFDFNLTLSRFPVGVEEIEVMVNGEPYTMVLDADRTYHFEFQLRHGEWFRIEGLPHGVWYDVIEAAVSGFIQEIVQEVGMIFRDELSTVMFYNEVIPEEPEPEDTSLRICKALENEDAHFPSKTFFQFILNIDGELYAEFELRAGECRVIEGLPVGAEFEVWEVNIPTGYVLVSSGQSVGTLTETEIVVTFVNRQELRDIPVEKLWRTGDLTGMRLPEYITVQLLDGSTVVAAARIREGADGSWSHVFTVPRYRNGVEIEYTVRELPVPGWLDSVRIVDGVFVITNTALTPITERLEVEKRITGAPGADKAFGFVLSAVDGAPLPEESRLYITGANRDAFELEFTQAGTFVYRVHEVVPNEVGNWRYDRTVFTVTFVVEVIDGELVVTSRTILGDGVATDQVIFVNSYETEEIDPGRPTPPTPRPPDNGEGNQTSRPPVQSTPPPTGDVAQMNLWIKIGVLNGIAVLVASIRVYLLLKKRE